MAFLKMAWDLGIVKCWVVVLILQWKKHVVMTVPKLPQTKALGNVGADFTQLTYLVGIYTYYHIYIFAFRTTIF
jgi:hypothetical protein